MFALAQRRMDGERETINSWFEPDNNRSWQRNVRRAWADT